MVELRQQLNQYRNQRAELASSQALTLLAGALLGGLIVWAVAVRVVG